MERGEGDVRPRRAKCWQTTGEWLAPEGENASREGPVGFRRSNSADKTASTPRLYSETPSGSVRPCMEQVRTSGSHVLRALGDRTAPSRELTTKRVRMPMRLGSTFNSL